MSRGIKHLIKRTAVACLISFFLLTINPIQLALALPGDLDTSFSGDGKATTDIFKGSFDSVNSVAIQPDGKIVVAGRSANDFALARYNSNGTLDTSFSGDGKLTTDFGSSDTALAVAIQPDGKIVVAGKSANDFALARYNSNGTLDTSFSGDGKVITDFFGGTENISAVAIQPDGKIVVAGRSGDDFALARYTFDGRLDTSFSEDGKLTTDFLGTIDVANAVAIQSDGKIVVAGSVSLSSDDDNEVIDFAVARYNSNGTLDISFNDGKVRTNIRGTDRATAVAIQPDGKIVVAGEGDNDFAVARYNSNGTLDTSFSEDGRLTTDFLGTIDRATAVAIQPDRKIVVAGESHTVFPDEIDNDFAVARYNSNGTLDTSFSGDGIATTDFNGLPDFPGALAIQKNDGRIVVAGRSANDFAVTRYHAFECNGSNVTAIGTTGSDTLLGRVIINPQTLLFFPLPDVIHGLGGNDSINAGGNDDIVCGGGGSDTISGGSGNDTLLGQNNADSLDGGAGTDTCIGGGQSGDTFSLCETINTGSSGFSGTWIDISQTCNRSGKKPICRVKGVVEVENPGTESTAVPTQVAFYLSEDEVLDENDRFLKYVNVSALEPGERTDVRLNVKLNGEEDLFGLFGIVVLDFFNSVPEVNEDNNTVVSPPIQ